MGETTAIAWTDHTFNPWWGCTRVSAGCQNCYAETFAKRTGHDVWGAKAPRRVIGDHTWNDPIRWDRAARQAGRRDLVFCASMADVYEDVDDDTPMVDSHGNVVAGRTVRGERARLFDLMASTPNLVWQVLTKRPENVLRLSPDHWAFPPEAEAEAEPISHPLNAERGRTSRVHPCWPTNVWIGTTVEDQERADERVPVLATLPAPVRFLSCEPLLGPVDLSRWLHLEWMDALRLPGAPLSFRGEGGWGQEMFGAARGDRPAIQWVIVGGESGPRFRAMDLAHARDLVDQCRAAEVAVFYKQTGGRTPSAGGHTLDGETIQEFPAGWR